MAEWDDEDPGLPIKLNPCSNGEFVPEPPTPLVREGGISFRDAHEIIAHVVVGAIDAGKSADQITLPMVQAAAQAQLGHPVTLSADRLRDALDPTAGVTRRNGVGGPASSSVRKMIDASGRAIDLEVDGGIGADNIARAVAAGANVLVAGTATFRGGPDHYADNIRRLRGG